MELCILWEKIGDAPAKVVGYTQISSSTLYGQSTWSKEIENWIEALKDYNGFPVERYITRERLIRKVSDIKGLN